MFYLRNYDNKLANEFISIYNSYNNEAYMSQLSDPVEKKIEEVLGQIKYYENEAKNIARRGNRRSTFKKRNTDSFVKKGSSKSIK